MNRFVLATSALVAALCVGQASAADLSGVFVRADIGKSRLIGDGFDSSHRDSAFDIRGGYYFTPHFGVEAFYSNLYNKTTQDVEIISGMTITTRHQARLRGIGVGVVGKYNFGGEQTGLFVSGRAGMMRSSTKVDLYDSDGKSERFQSHSNSATRPYFGMSAGYDITPNMGVSVNLDEYRLRVREDGETLSFKSRVASVGFEYRF